MKVVGVEDNVTLGEEDAAYILSRVRAGEKLALHDIAEERKLIGPIAGELLGGDKAPKGLFGLQIIGLSTLGCLHDAKAKALTPGSEGVSVGYSLNREDADECGADHSIFLPRKNTASPRSERRRPKSSWVR